MNLKDPSKISKPKFPENMRALAGKKMSPVEEYYRLENAKVL